MGTPGRLFLSHFGLFWTSFCDTLFDFSFVTPRASLLLPEQHVCETKFVQLKRTLTRTNLYKTMHFLNVNESPHKELLGYGLSSKAFFMNKQGKRVNCQHTSGQLHQKCLSREKTPEVGAAAGFDSLRYILFLTNWQFSAVSSFDHD